MNAAAAELARQQGALLQALLARPGSATADAAQALLMGPPGLLTQDLTGHSAAVPSVPRGLAVYRANAHATAVRALRAAYPVLEALVGADNFAGLAQDFWHHDPPTRGDLAQWGDTLAAFLQASAALADTPYLGDVARAEWALHRAASAADATPDGQSFRRLLQEDTNGLTLTLAPALVLLRSRFPVASILAAHRQPGGRLDSAARRLQAGVGEWVLVWRQGLCPRCREAQAQEAVLLGQLLAGHDLAQSLMAACSAPGETATGSGPPDEAVAGFDFSAWLNAAVTEGLVIGVHRLAGDSDPQHLENTP